MDTRTKRMGQTNTDKNKKRKNWVHAFKTPFFIDIQQDMVKDKVSFYFRESLKIRVHPSCRLSPRIHLSPQSVHLQ